MTGIWIDLDCAAYDVTGASIGHARGGSVFRCTIGPLTDEVLKTLDEVARSHGTVRLMFPKQPVVLERIEVTRIEPSSARISGHLLGGSS